MSEKEKQAEEKILDAANKVFIEKGFYGARMQEIADKAGINKAMLHYYYRSKDKLFERVFEQAVKSLFVKIGPIPAMDIPFDDKIRNFVSNYIEMLAKYPQIPMFILHEINTNPDKIEKIFRKNLEMIPKNILIQFREEVEKGNYKDISAEQFIINILGLSIFPFLSRPLLQKIFDISDDGFDKLLEERKTLIPEIIFNGLKINKE